jgi:hypothetical protein
MSTLDQPTANTNPAIITESKFNHYTTSWMQALENPDLTGPPLQSYFRIGSNATPIGQFSFKADDMINVLSTVGLHTIKIQFGITPAAIRPALFTPILVGYDRSGLQVTPYYVGDIPEADLISGPTPSVITDYSSDQVPYVLVNKWIGDWSTVTTIDNSLFYTSFGYLRGYTFLMQDFLDDLSLLTTNDGTFVVVYLALHKYYGSDNLMKSTFGLVISAQSSAPPLPAGQLGAYTVARRQVYYDLSAPCPPTC